MSNINNQYDTEGLTPEVLINVFLRRLNILSNNEF